MRSDDALELARPRLLRQATAYGIPLDAVDDVVQETLIEAWSHVDGLRSPERFEAWLSGICRNVCLRWSTGHKRALQRHTQGLGQWLVDPVQHDEPYGEELVDEQASDPVDVVISQDLRCLVARMLDQLPHEYRVAVELYYLAELPQRATALRLGLSVSALETRLHRARRQLRDLLAREFRDDALAFGFAPEACSDLNWHAARIPCRQCGHYQLSGTFETLPDGGINLRTRCPGCEAERETRGLIPLHGVRSVKPALKRVEHWILQHLTPQLQHGWHTCPWCGLCAPMLTVMPIEQALAGDLLLSLHCPGCDREASTWAWKCLHRHPEIQHFMLTHPQWISRSAQPVQFNELSAWCLRLDDRKSRERLLLYVHAQTLAVLATVHE
ncbi:hypothetical protein KDA_61010 [Dictyobacter alpinus]|uniref:RNA polymerase sigma factor n=2 Tax=Dictyobacter alpinus TaxID=2014873 RepID=A0A402BH91_9CHLR|nr:hypothetical protein KDA_61010 [Dictyobacter alpinus]